MHIQVYLGWNLDFFWASKCQFLAICFPILAPALHIRYMRLRTDVLEKMEEGEE